VVLWRITPLPPLISSPPWRDAYSSDLWAVGVILFQLLSGKAPFRGGNAHQTFQKVKAGEYEVPNMFPPKGLVLFQPPLPPLLFFFHPAFVW